jgi:hypothetical protein
MGEFMSQLFFKKRYQDAIRAGCKSTTIRRWGRPMVRVGRRAFSPGLGWLSIEAVDPVAWDELDDADASADGFATAIEMKRLLLEIYPGHENDGKQWFRVRFRLNELQKKPRVDQRSAPLLFD